jgi:hypothetical protein
MLAGLDQTGAHGIVAFLGEEAEDSRYPHDIPI